MKTMSWCLSLAVTALAAATVARSAEWDHHWDEASRSSFQEPVRAYPDEDIRDIFPADPVIRGMLRRAGLTSDAIRQLQRDHFEYGRVAETVEESLVAQGADRDAARRRANELAQRIDRLDPAGFWGGTTAPPPAPSRGYRQEADRPHFPQQDQRPAGLKELRDELLRLGLYERQIDRLQRRGFPPEDVRVLVQDKLEDRGAAPAWAQRRAQEVATQIQQWREYGRNHRKRSKARTRAPGRSTVE